ncbi:MAG: hypothetical protein RLZZ241_1159 [Bacteroidota bacterium]|jgi:molybdate transport system ATP-binding protein
MPKHVAIFTDNNSRKTEFSREILSGNAPDFLSYLNGLKGGYFSNIALSDFLEEEAKHLHSELNVHPQRDLKTFSSGERKRTLLHYLMQQNPDYLILDDPFDNLDRAFQHELKQEFLRIQQSTAIIQLVSRSEDHLPFITEAAFLEGEILIGYPDYSHKNSTLSINSEIRIPEAPNNLLDVPKILVDLRGISLSYAEQPILDKIVWRIEKGDFWELRGPNGSGKSTLITLISGDNPKAFGMELYLFGAKKGSGESVWDIKGLIGYFTPAMTDRFRGYHSIENMLISGLNDSVGLYVQPGDGQRALALQWLKMLGMEHLKDQLFCDLTAGQQRLIFCARAMIKHPPLLILDEPTAGLDAAAATQVVALINKMAQESDTALLFVSHRNEPGLHAKRIFELRPSPKGSTGHIRNN